MPWRGTGFRGSLWNAPKVIVLEPSNASPGRSEQPPWGNIPVFYAVIVHDELLAMKHFFASGDVGRLV